MTTSSTQTTTPSNEELASQMAAMAKTLKEMQAAQEAKNKKAVYMSVAVGSIASLAAIYLGTKYITRALTSDDSSTTDAPV